MAEIQLTTEQQQHMERLTTALGQDTALRERLQQNPRAVFGEYGLDGILPAEMQFDVNINEPEVVGYAPPHIDYTTHRDVVIHADAHSDFVIPMQIGGTVRRPGAIG